MKYVQSQQQRHQNDAPQYVQTRPNNLSANVVSYVTIYKLFEYNFWWKCLEFSDKMDPTIQMTIFAKHRNTIRFKFGDIFFTFLTMLGLQAKASICSAIK